MNVRSPLCWADINLRALRDNYRLFADLVPAETLLMPIIKSEAYGHGMIATARALQTRRKLWGFGVANTNEAFALRKNSITARILVLSSYPSDHIMSAIRRAIDLVVGSPEQLQDVERMSRRVRRAAHIHLKLDTGTTRIGFREEDVPQLLRLLRRAHHVSVQGIMSHFADSEAQSEQFTKRQLARFRLVAEKLRSLLPKSPQHIACTAAIARFPESHGDIVRVGLGLYGVWPSAPTARAVSAQERRRLKPVLSWKTRILRVKRVPRGTNIGYARTFRTSRPTLVGILPVGYGDGYPWSLGNRGFVLARGRRCRIAGRVCMNLTMVDLTSAPSARSGDEVVLIGEQGTDRISADDVARWAGTISYEILARIHSSVLRRYP